MSDRDALLRELMAVFDELPAPLREAINYAPEPLDPSWHETDFLFALT